MTSPGPRAILVDDEDHLSQYLANKLARLWPELTIAGTAKNGREALKLCADVRPDIVFLDINMPGLSGMEVARTLTDTHIVFVTAYDEYAVAAFERAAVDYLLKPVDDRRLKQTIERLKSLAPSEAAPNEIEALIQRLTDSLGGAQSGHLRWLRAGLEEVTELIAVDEVVYFKADAKYTSVFTRDAERLVRMSIKELAARLDPDVFWQIHRGMIVRVDQIENATRDLRGRYTLKLRDRPETLRTSQAYGHLFKQM